MAHTPHDTERVIEKAFIVRFFADGGFRVEGPFPPLQVQRLIDTNECQAWLRDPALFAVWGREPIANISELFTLAPEINEIASRLAHKRYQPLKGEPFPGLVYRRGEFSIAGNMLALPGFGPIPMPGDIPPQGKIVSVTLQEDADGWTATFEVEKDGE